LRSSKYQVDRETSKQGRGTDVFRASSFLFRAEFQKIRKGEQDMETVSNSKGQIVIPAKLRKQLGIKDGTHFQIDMNEATRQIILTPIIREYFRSLRGKYKGKGLMKALMAEKKREREL
jgi:AbrB family looped-hinge helix DNA binding protein